MQTYEFRLQRRAVGPLREQVLASDDDEARNLAELRLLMTSGVERVSVHRAGVQVLNVERDAARSA